MVLGIDLGRSRVRLLPDDQAIVARTGRLPVSRGGRGQSDEKGGATLPDSNDGVLGAADLCTILNTDAKNTEPTTRFPDSIRMVWRNVGQTVPDPCSLPMATNGCFGRQEINRSDAGALLAGCGARFRGAAGSGVGALHPAAA
jgi:hypothetical protein